MKLKKLLLPLLGLFFISLSASAQIVTLDPSNATIDDEVTIIYDATKGTSGLQGASKVYMHSSVGTDPNGQEWNGAFNVGDWGQDDGVGEMTSLGNDKWSITITPRNYYSIPEGTTVYNLAMVFRNANASQEGKSDSNGNIYVAINPGFLTISFVEPSTRTVTPQAGEQIDIVASTFNVADSIILYDDGVEIAKVMNEKTIQASITANSAARHKVMAVAHQGTQRAADSMYYFNVVPKTQNIPDGLKEGINYIADDSVVLKLYAPNKNTAFLLTDFSEWEMDPRWQLGQSEDKDYFWIGVGGLTAGQEYNFQYIIDQEIRITDPYAEKVVYEYDNGQIPNEVYPDELLAYPNGKTYGPVAVLQPGKAPYQWKVTDFQAPKRDELVIYELLIRDFAVQDESHEIGTYQAVLDSLPYLIDLGINAIEFMPVKEFAGQDSWGYNPAHFTALEKAYGTPQKFKELIDACHENGIAVILDVVFNHTEYENPVAKMYWDHNNGRPAANSPWLNQEATHPFNVFSDFNHESPATKKFVDIVTQYWLDEYKIDGFRFDLSKGFTQKQSNDDGVFRSRDDSRIAIIKEIADKVWSKHPDTYIILEHFADNEEETILANYTNADQTNSLMLWGNMHGAFEDNIQGFSGANIEWTSHLTRGWDYPGVVGYMESHDEQRQMYAALEGGNPIGASNTKDIAAQRIAAANALFYTIPGPKMLWQFGELGYDYHINYCPTDGTIQDKCRTDRKPIRWDYTEDPARFALYEATAQIIKLRSSYDVFNTANVKMNADNDLARYVTLINRSFTENPTTPEQMNVVTMANLDVKSREISPQFPHTGNWYNAFTGEILKVTSENQSVLMPRNTYLIYTDVNISGIATSAEDDVLRASIGLYPNPAQDKLQLNLANEAKGSVAVSIVDLLGKVIATEHLQKRGEQLSHTLDISKIPSGMYILQVATSEGRAGKAFFKQ